MTLLVISPDYASHAVPLLTIAGAWLRRGHRVVVATGPAMAPLVRSRSARGRAGRIPERTSACPRCPLPGRRICA